MARTSQDKLFAGVDVGGTNVQSTLVTPGGRVLGRERIDTPQEKNPGVVVEAILNTVRDVVSTGGGKMSDLAGVGIAIPGVVDPAAGRIINTANMNLGGIDLGPLATKKLGAPVFLGNDVNLGTLGEKWLGTAMEAESLVGMFVGTGIGGGVIVDGRLVTGAADGGGEIGHMIMSMGGPKCGCGLRGCFESLASRLAIERDIRKAVADGRKSLIADLVDLNKSGERIRSGTLRKALSKGDEVVTEVVDRAAEIMGVACLSIRRVIDPEVFLFGGGVIEACGTHILPIIERIIASDPLASPKPAGRVLESALGDDAVPLGGVALAQQQLGLDPFAKARQVRYPKVSHVDGHVHVGGKRREALLIRADGELIEPEAMASKLVSDLGKGRLGDRSVRQLCVGQPKTVFVALPTPEPLRLSDRAQVTLHFHDFALEMLPASQAVTAFSDCRHRKALLLPGPLAASGKD